MQAPQITHDEYCRIIGQIYVDADQRIRSLESQLSSASNPLPLIQSLQAQIAKLKQENTTLNGNLEEGEAIIKDLRERLP